MDIKLQEFLNDNISKSVKDQIMKSINAIFSDKDLNEEID